MTIRASLRGLERRVARAFPTPPCDCPWCIVVGKYEPKPPPFCPRCGKQRLVIVVHSETFHRRREAAAS